MDTVPFEVFRKILSYLDLDEVIRSRLVSRLWCAYVDNFVETKLFYSERPKGQILGKNRLVTGKFTQNFIASSKFEAFFGNFSRTIFSGLKHLRIAHLNIDCKTFPQVINSLDQLEDLDLIKVTVQHRGPNNPFDEELCQKLGFTDHQSAFFQNELNLPIGLDHTIQLNLPNLKSIEFDQIQGIYDLTLDTPKLSKIRLWDCGSLKLDLVHESVEHLVTDYAKHLNVEKQKNLKYYYCSFLTTISSTFLSSLQHLKEIHLDGYFKTFEIHRQRLQYNRPDLKIYYFGLLVNDPSDPINTFPFDYFSNRVVNCYVQNYQRLADEVLFYMWFDYTPIERVVPTVQVNIWNRFVKMNDIRVDQPVRDTGDFLNFLKNFDNLETLSFSCKQPQRLFDQLPNYCSVQTLTIGSSVKDLEFLFKLSHLVDLSMHSIVDTEFIRRIFGQLKFLLRFSFLFQQSYDCEIQIVHPKLFQVKFRQYTARNFESLNEVISFLTDRSIQERNVQN